MADHWVLSVGVNQPLHAEFPPTAYAEADARAVAEAFGVDARRQFVLGGQYATRAAVESRFRKLQALVRPGDHVLVFWAGDGFTLADRGFLTCWDTLPDDRPATALSLERLFEDLHALAAANITVFLNVGGLPSTELAQTCESSAKVVALVACTAEERPLATPAIKHGVWSQLVAEGLAGRGRKAVSADGTITPISLQRWIEDELPRRLRKHFESGAGQTPKLYGDQNAGHILKTIPVAPETGVLDGGRLRRVVFRAEPSTKVKELTNFRKTFTVPDAATPANRKFIQRLATDDIKTELDRVFDACREHLGYKRKDIEVSVGQDGVGHLRTPDFDYTLVVDLDTDEPARVVWRHEASRFANPEFVRSDGFQQVLGPRFDQLVFEFAVPIDVTEFVDRMEDRPPAGLKLSVAADGKSCDLRLSGFAGTVTVKRHAITIQGRSGNAAGLLDVFLQFIGSFGSAGEPMLLGPAS